MKVLILFDNGETTKIANAMYDTLKKEDIDVSIKQVDAAKKDDVLKSDLLIIGSPTKAWSSSPRIQKFLSQFNNYDFRTKSAAAFGLMEKHFLAGSASRNIVKFLRALRFNIISQQDFYTTKEKITPEEIERARKFAKYIWMF